MVLLINVLFHELHLWNSWLYVLLLLRLYSHHHDIEIVIICFIVSIYSLTYSLIYSLSPIDIYLSICATFLWRGVLRGFRRLFFRQMSVLYVVVVVRLFFLEGVKVEMELRKRQYHLRVDEERFIQVKFCICLSSLPFDVLSR